MEDKPRHYFAKLLTLFCLCFPVLWLYLPNLALIYYNPSLGYSLKSLGLIITILCTIPILLLISNNLRQFWLWNLPFAAISGFYTGYIMYYHDIPYDGMWFALWNASAEVIEGIAIYFKHYSFIGVAGFIIYCLCICHPKQKQIVFSKLFKSYYLLASLICASVIICVTNFLSQRIPIQRLLDQSVTLQNYPYGMLGMLVKTSVAFSKGSRTPVAALKRSSIPAGREIYVFVLGEAARADDWQAISQSMHSSLLTDHDIRIFKQASSQANLTSLALPLLMSGTSTLQEAFNHPLWMSLAKAAGCTTGWITNATEPYNYPYQNDFYDLNINRKAWAGVSGVTYDEVLLPEIQRTLSQGPQKLCLVVHFIGSHFDYRLRYRADFAKYAVNNSDYDDFNSALHDNAFRNAYDNSLIETNMVLQNIIAILKKEDATSFLIYTSDHGESFDDGGNKLFFHGNEHPPRAEMEVPFFIWANNKFQQQYPEKWKALQENQSRKISNQQVLPTLLDALSVSDIPTYLAPSLLQPYKKDITQMVLLPSINLVTFESLA